MQRVLWLVVCLCLAGSAFAATWESQVVPETLATPGSTTEDPAGVFTIEAAGADIWGTTDEFRYMYDSDAPMSGDFILQVHLQSLIGGTNPWAKAGIMVRGGAPVFVGPESFVDVVATPANGICLQWRDGDGVGAAWDQATGQYLAGPNDVDLKLQRVGDEFFGYGSEIEHLWVSLGSFIPAALSGLDVYIGLGVTSHEADVLTTAVFDSFDLDADPLSANGITDFLCVAGDVNVDISWLNNAAYSEIFLYRKDTAGDLTRIAVDSADESFTEAPGDGVWTYLIGAQEGAIDTIAQTCTVKVGGVEEIEGWFTADIADEGLEGAVEIFPNAGPPDTWDMEITGSGRDIENPADDFRYVWKEFDADDSFIVQARLDAFPRVSNDWGKGGIMVRTNRTDDSPMVFAMIRPGAGNHESTTQWRDATGDGNFGWTGTLTPASPLGWWIRGMYTAGSFTSFFAQDTGAAPEVDEWIEGATHALNLEGATEILAGLAVTSHDNAQVMTASFSQVQIIEFGSGGVENLTAAFNGDNVDLNWTLAGDTLEEIRVSRLVIGGDGLAEELDVLAGTATSFEDTTLPTTAIVVGYTVTPVLQGIALTGQNVSVLRDGYVAFQEGSLPTTDYVGGQDAHIIYHQSNLDEYNTGGHTYIEEGDWGTVPSDPKEALVQFDIQDITTVESATLYLYYALQRNGTVDTEHTSYAIPILKEWAEGTGAGVDGRVAVDGEVTWQSPMRNMDSWQLWDDFWAPCADLDALRSGGAYGPEDIDESYAVEGTEYGVLATPTWVEWDVSDIVCAWASGDLPGNYGFKITQGIGNDPCHFGVQGGYDFISSENTAVGLRPILVVKPGNCDGGGGTRVFTGDVNNDGAVNIADAIFLLGILFGGSGDVPACAKAADTNDDNATNIADAISILGYLFGGGQMTDPDGVPIATGAAACGTYSTAEVEAHPGGCATQCTP